MRIAKSSKEQDGYERHRTRPVPASLVRAHEAPERHRRWRQKISKTDFGFKRRQKRFCAPRRSNTPAPVGWSTGLGFSCTGRTAPGRSMDSPALKLFQGDDVIVSVCSEDQTRSKDALLRRRTI